MISFIYAPIFVRQYKKLGEDLKEEVLQKIDLLKNRDNHNLLKVHKLHGKFKESHSLYINYKIRVVFMWNNKEEIALLAIGDHDIYK